MLPLDTFNIPSNLSQQRFNPVSFVIFSFSSKQLNQLHCGLLAVHLIKVVQQLKCLFLVVILVIKLGRLNLPLCYTACYRYIFHILPSDYARDVRQERVKIHI